MNNYFITGTIGAMSNSPFPENMTGLKVFMVGIKGTGMAALAELLYKSGAVVSGSDRAEKFYTDKILQNLGIPYYESFNAEYLPEDAEVVVHSSAYPVSENPQLILAERKGIPVIEYAEALGALSERSFSVGISGVHGKTTTTAIAGTLLKGLDLSATVLVGSGVSNFSGSSVFVSGNGCFVAETCEYKRHFLQFNPDVVVITNIEEDHLDYFMDIDDIYDAFVSYGQKLPERGTLIYCADDPGAVQAAEKITSLRKDIKKIAYGGSCDGKYRISEEKVGDGATFFRLQGFDFPFSIKIPGHHIVLDAAAAVAVAVTVLEKEGISVDSGVQERLAAALSSFRGSKRRSEIVGEWKGIMIMDDYGHHPTEIYKTLKGLKDFYPGRRLIVDFASHTYSRTEALIEEFSSCFTPADVVILHKIYASAREKKGNITGRDLYEKVRGKMENVYYFDEALDSLEFCLKELTEGDIFITMGAGDNWTLGKRIAEELNKAE